MKHKQKSDAMFLTIRALTDAGIALHDKVAVGESAQVVEAIQIRQYLTT
jgi:hypothetical protein